MSFVLLQVVTKPKIMKSLQKPKKLLMPTWICLAKLREVRKSVLVLCGRLGIQAEHENQPNNIQKRSHFRKKHRIILGIFSAMLGLSVQVVMELWKLGGELPDSENT